MLTRSKLLLWLFAVCSRCTRRHFTSTRYRGNSPLLGVLCFCSALFHSAAGQPTLARGWAKTHAPYPESPAKGRFQLRAKTWTLDSYSYSKPVYDANAKCPTEFVMFQNFKHQIACIIMYCLKLAVMRWVKYWPKLHSTLLGLTGRVCRVQFFYSANPELEFINPVTLTALSLLPKSTASTSQNHHFMRKIQPQRQKYHSEFTKTHHFKRKIHFSWGGS